MKCMAFDSGSVTVAAAGSTTLVTVTTGGGFDRLSLALENEGVAVALDAYEVEVQYGKDGAWADYNTAWAAAGAILLHYSGNLAALAAAGTGGAILNLNGVYAFRIVASAAAGGTTARVWGVYSGA